MTGKAITKKATRYKGVYTVVNPGRQGKKTDTIFYINYRYKEGDQWKVKWEKIGKASEGYTAKLASHLRAERLRAIRHGEEFPQKKKKAPYFRDVAAKYLEWAKTNRVRGGRDELYRYRKHLAPAFDNKRLNEISPFHLERLKSNLTKDGLSPATVKHALVLVREIFNKAIKWRLYDGENPVKEVKMPKLNNERTRFLSHEEAETLLEELQKSSKQLHDMALLSLHCGLRAGEIFNLKGQDIDFENERIRISNPKNKRTRYAYMTHAVKDMLQSYMPKKPDELIFKDRNGKKIVEISSTFARVIKRLEWNEGITDAREKVTFHTLRHTFASWLALQGEPILTIKELMGHKSLAMTERYSHLIPDQKRKATLKLERGFQEGKTGNVINLQK